jgi:hypothetical protein
LTQIIAAVTEEYVILASDRRLTYADGHLKGQPYRDTRKLVSLCGTTGIGYSGVGEMKGRIPTHEWIAKTLAEAGCVDAASAERTLIARTPDALSATPPRWRSHIFVLAGWAHFGSPPILRPYLAKITNMVNASGQEAERPLESFSASRRYLREQEDLLWTAAGERVITSRAGSLDKNLRRLIRREIGPKEALRLLVDEVIHTSKYCSSVGSKVLGFCIPKKAAQQFFEKGKQVMLAAQPNPDAASFTYFEEGYSELRQYGPTTICGQWAVTDVETENDPSRDFQSSSIRILSAPSASPSKTKSG